jgi:hypothetical protein
MATRHAGILTAIALLVLYAGPAWGADAEAMKATCRGRAAEVFGVAASAVELKYEGQRIDKTHAVNGSALVGGQSVTFQCSFAPGGQRIAKFTVNSRQPAPGASSTGSLADTQWRLPDSSPSDTAGVPAAPEDGGPRNWVVTGAARALNLREQPSTTANVIARYAPGTILDNLGCRRAENRFWCDVQQLGGGPRGYVSAEFLKPAVSPDGSVATGPDDSALRAGRGEFDASGSIPCAQSLGQPMMQCEFGVARAGGGYATVVIKKPDGRTRAIFFRMGKPMGTDTSQADGPGRFGATREADLNFIRIGNERYEIPDAVVLGG